MYIIFFKNVMLTKKKSYVTVSMHTTMYITVRISHKNFRTANSFYEREERLDNIESTISPGCLVTG